MFSVTDRAKFELEEMLKDLKLQPDKGLRLIKTEDGTLAVALDSKKEEDHVIQLGKREVLFVEMELNVILAASELDSEVTEEGPEFFLKPKGSPPEEGNGTATK